MYSINNRMSHKNIPYTYLVGWSDTGMYYYGVRYASNANPDELWKSYFTSSKHIQHFRAKHGEPDIIEVRQIFDCVDRARAWEHKVLRRISAVNRLDFLNHTDNISIPVTDHDRAANFTNYLSSIRGRKRSDYLGEDVDRRLSKITSETHRGKKVSAASRKKMSIAAKANQQGTHNIKSAYRKVSCLKCQKAMIFSNYKRWHNH